MERERLERRIVEEKDKYEKRYQQLEEEYEAKLNEMATMHEEEVENLNGDLRENETQNGQLLQQYQHEISLKTQQIENLEKHNQELKENLSNLQNTHNNTFESQIMAFKEER